MWITSLEAPLLPVQFDFKILGNLLVTSQYFSKFHYTFILDFCYVHWHQDNASGLRLENIWLE
jgi:hypothetical protein